MVHVYGAKAFGESLARDERACLPGQPWEGDESRVLVVFHLSFVHVGAATWTCLACGTSSGEWVRA